MGLFIRTIGIARAKTKIGLANLVYNIKRLLFLRRIAAAGSIGALSGALNIANTAPVVHVRQNPARKPIKTAQPRSMVACRAILVTKK